MHVGDSTKVTHTVLYTPGMWPWNTTQRRVDLLVPGGTFLDGVGVGVKVGELSISCSQALSSVSDSGVSEKWEKMEESESVDTRREEGFSREYGGAGDGGVNGLDGGSGSEEGTLGDSSWEQLGVEGRR